MAFLFRLRFLYGFQVGDDAVRVVAVFRRLDRDRPAANVLEDAGDIEAEEVVARLVAQVGKGTPENPGQVDEGELHPVLLGRRGRPAIGVRKMRMMCRPWP